MDAPSYDDLRRIARDEMLSRSQSLTLEVIERDGSEANILSHGIAAVGDELAGALTRVAAGLYLDSAQGRALDKLVFSKFGLVRRPASQALGTVELSTTAPAPGAVPVPRGTRFQTADGREFISWADTTYPISSTGPVLVQVRSVLSGADQQAAAGTITSLSSQLAGSPTDLRVTNTLATAGAADEETDDSLRDRARRFFSTVRRGTVAAIEAAALNVPGVLRANAFEYLDVYGRPVKAAQVVVADTFTDALVEQGINPPTYQTQSQALASLVATELEEWRAAGVYVNVLVAQVVLVAVTLALRFHAGVEVDTVALSARAMVASRINELSPGETLTPAMLVERLRMVDGLDVTGEEILSPPGIIETAPLQVLRSTLSMVVASTVQPDRALQGNANADGV